MTQINPEQRTEIYYKKSEAFKRQEEILRTQWHGLDRNKELIQGFQQHLFARGTGQYRVAKLTMHMRHLCSMNPEQPLDKLTKKDAEAIVAAINRNESWGEHSKSDHRRVLKQFFKWFEDEDRRLQNGSQESRDNARRLYKYLQRDVIGKPKHQSMDYSGIITEEDALLLIDKGCRTPLERAMVAVLHETGCRVGELLNLRIRDIEHKERHGMLRLDGKTGDRRVPIIQSLPHLVKWIENHPHKENRDALLWISIHAGQYGRPFRYVGVKRILEKVFVRANIKKKNNAHHFRHSRATLIATKYSESVLCKIMGWSLGSRQVRTYVHLGAGQVEEAFLKNHGIIDDKKQAPTVQFCSCGTTNEPTSRYCYKCGRALNVAVALEDTELMRSAIDEAVNELLVKILKDPAKLQRYEEKKNQR